MSYAYNAGASGMDKRKKMESFLASPVPEINSLYTVNPKKSRSLLSSL